MNDSRASEREPRQTKRHEHNASSPASLSCPFTRASSHIPESPELYRRYHLRSIAPLDRWKHLRGARAENHKLNSRDENSEHENPRRESCIQKCTRQSWILQFCTRSYHTCSDSWNAPTLFLDHQHVTPHTLLIAPPSYTDIHPSTIADQLNSSFICTSS